MEKKSTKADILANLEGLIVHCETKRNFLNLVPERFTSIHPAFAFANLVHGLVHTILETRFLIISPLEPKLAESIGAVRVLFSIEKDTFGLVRLHLGDVVQFHVGVHNIFGVVIFIHFLALLLRDDVVLDLFFKG